MPRYTKDIPALLRVGRAEVEVTLLVHYHCTPGRPPWPPAYDHGGLPAEDPEVIVDDILLDRIPLPTTVENALAEDIDFLTLLGEACEWGTER